MNFIIDLFSSKRDRVLHDLIFVIIDKSIKMIKYLLVSIKINISKLIKYIFRENYFIFQYVSKYY